MENSEKQSILRPVIPGFSLPGSFTPMTLEPVEVSVVQVVELRITTSHNFMDFDGSNILPSLAVWPWIRDLIQISISSL